MSMSGIQSLVVHGTVNFVGGNQINTSNSECPLDPRFTTYVSWLVFSPQAMHSYVEASGRNIHRPMLSRRLKPLPVISYR